jgi:Universal stress protein family
MDSDGEPQYAVWFADIFGSSIDVLNVIEQESLDKPERLRDLSSSSSQAMERAVPKRAKEFSNPKAFVEVGNAHHQILRNIKDDPIDLLVLGIRKTSHLGIETRASRAFQLIVDATCPVLTLVA